MYAKKLLYISSVCLLVSCGRSDITVETPQERIDSMVNVKVAAIRSQIQASNDSVINALARKQADSIIKAAHNENKQAAAQPKPFDNRPPLNRPLFPQDTLGSLKPNN